jgi:hypothetical protein
MSLTDDVLGKRPILKIHEPILEFLLRSQLSSEISHEQCSNVNRELESFVINLHWTPARYLLFNPLEESQTFVGF